MAKSTWTGRARHGAALGAVAVAVAAAGGGWMALSARAADPNSPPAATNPSKDVISIDGHVFRPRQVQFKENMLSRLKVPDGFEVNVYAKGLLNARMLAVAEDGTVYLTRRNQNDVLMLPDRDGDGRADGMKSVVSDVKLAHGIAIKGRKLYVGDDDKVRAYDLKDDGTVAGEPTVVTDRLPHGGQHPNKTFLFGPDEHLYLSVGSSCNACKEPNPESATMLRVSPDGKSREVFARGLRNTIGFAFHPRTGQFWGWDHGMDWLGDEYPPEELNLLAEGKDYGWPYIWGDRQINPTDEPPEGSTLEQYAQKTEPPVLTYDAHAAPMAFVFYTAEMFPEEYRRDAFVTMRGSWNRAKPSGYRVLRVRFGEDDRPAKIEDFVTGFLTDDGKAQFGRPCGMAVAKDGSLLFTDDTQGVVYRVSYAAKQ